MCVHQEIVHGNSIEGILGGYEEVYNFYLSQLRITIERAFGVLVHQWAILRAPLVIPLRKVSPLVLSLVHLHNFCIDQSELSSFDIPSSYQYNIFSNVKTSQIFGSGAEADIVEFDELGRHMSILGCCHNFNDSKKYRQAANVRTPMDDMIHKVKILGLSDLNNI